MRKIIAILVLTLYIFPAVGMNVTVHYCAGKVASVSFFGEAKSCACGSKKVKKSCCENKHLSFSIKDDQQKTPGLNLVLKKVIDSELSYIATLAEGVILYVPVQENHINGSEPPGESKRPLYLLNRVFRI